MSILKSFGPKVPSKDGQTYWLFYVLKQDHDWQDIHTFSLFFRHCIFYLFLIYLGDLKELRIRINWVYFILLPIPSLLIYNKLVN